MKMKKWMTSLSDRRKFVRAGLWTLMIVSSISVGRVILSYDYDGAYSRSIYLSVFLESPHDGTATLYYDVGEGFNEENSASVFVNGDGKIHQYLYKIPNKTIFHLRWDPPLSTHNFISIRKIQVLDGFQRRVKRLNLNQLEPLHQIQALIVSDDKADLQVQQGANDPQVKIRLESSISVNKIDSLAKYAGEAFLEFMVLFLAACLVIYVWLRWQDKVIATVIVISLLVLGWRCWILYDEAEQLFLQVAMSSSVNSTARVYYDLGQGLNEYNSVPLHITGGEIIRNYRFKLPNQLIYGLRFDPLTNSGRVKIGDILLTDVFGKVLQRFDRRQLKPGNQIQSLIFLDKVAEITIPANANDPQLNVPMNGPLNFIGVLPFPLWGSLLRIITEGILWILLASFFILVWKKWGGIFIASLDSSFVQEKLPLIYLGTAFGLILAMAFISWKDVHPDELGGHVKAASYYLQNWLPPGVDDPQMVEIVTRSAWGFSYLFLVDVIYFLAVKSTQFLSGIVTDFYLRLRLANALLYLLLIITFAFRIRKIQWTVLFLIMMPQLWYLFSYFNNDAFPLCISILLAWQVVDPESSLNCFLTESNFRTNLGRGIFVGVLLGFLLMSKLNYWIYICYIGFIGFWGILLDSAKEQRFLLLKKWIFIGCVALAAYLPIYGYSQYVNDFSRSDKIAIAMEKYAEPRFKPSTVQKDPSSTYPGFHLRDKGRSFQDVIIRNPEWWDLSFKSLFGLYGYMQFHSDKDYYQAVHYILVAFFIVVFFYVALALSTKDMIFFFFVLCFVILNLGLSSYHSWVNDYEPQGRYLFPSLPMLMIGLAKLPDSFRNRIMPLFCLVFFILSVWSFLMAGLMTIPKIN